MHRRCVTLLVLGLAIATQASPTRDEWQEDMIPGPPHGHATNENQVREHFWGGGDKTTSACLVGRNSAWEGYDCSKKTCQKYATTRWAPDLEACCNADAGQHDCTADWCLDEKWNSGWTRAASGFTWGLAKAALSAASKIRYYSCSDQAMADYCKADSKWYKDASECCPKQCGVTESGETESGTLDGLTGLFGGKSEETESGDGESGDGESGDGDGSLWGGDTGSGDSDEQTWCSPNCLW